MKKLFALALTSILLVGCNSTTPSTTTCVLESESETITMEAVGDEIQLYTDTFVLDVSSYNEEDRKELLSSFESNLDKVIGDSVGIRYSTSIENAHLTATLIIIPKATTPEELKALGLTDGDEYSSYSVKATIENLESQGYTCDQQYQK